MNTDMPKTNTPTTATLDTAAVDATIACDTGSGAAPKETPAVAKKATKAAPKPGEPGYDWTPHYDTDDLYTHTFADGTVVVLKSFRAIYSKTFLYKIKDLIQQDGTTEADIEFAAINRGACETAQEVLLSLDDSVGDPIDELWKAWTAAGTTHDGDDNGEGLDSGKSSG